MAHTAACVRSETLIRWNKRPQCDFTVFSLMPSSRPICLLLCPPTMSRRICRSRWVSEAPEFGCDRCVANELGGHRRTQRRTAVDGGADAGDQHFRLDVFDEVAACARGERRGDLLRFLERRQGDDRDLGVAGREDADGRDAVDDRHLQIHEHDIRCQSACELQCLTAIGRQTDDVDVGLRVREL